MKHKNTTYDYAELQKELLPQLRETVFHVTSGSGLKKILAEKKILPNINNCFEYSHLQSKNSFGIKKGYVCLFDLRDKTAQTLEQTLDYQYFLSNHNWNINAFLILDVAAHKDLIPNEAAVGSNKMHIPEVEVWSSTPIPLTKISNIIEVQITNRPDPF
ncbi:MAG: hypothetical protein ACI9UO_001693 [Nitrospinales bacterium]